MDFYSQWSLEIKISLVNTSRIELKNVYDACVFRSRLVLL